MANNIKHKHAGIINQAASADGKHDMSEEVIVKTLLEISPGKFFSTMHIVSGALI